MSDVSDRLDLVARLRRQLLTFNSEEARARAAWLQCEVEKLLATTQEGQ